MTGGLSTSEHAPEEKEERMREILLMKQELKVYSSASVVVWSGRHTLGQRCKILLNAFHKDR